MIAKTMLNIRLKKCNSIDFTKNDSINILYLYEYRYVDILKKKF